MTSSDIIHYRLYNQQIARAKFIGLPVNFIFQKTYFR